MGDMLIVVDMLNDFVHKDGALFFQAGADIIPAVQRRIEVHKRNNSVIIALRDWHDEDDKEFKRFPKHAVKRTWGARTAIVVGVYEFLIIPKTRYSGFYGTSLDTHLNFCKPDKVEVVGVCTSICVMDTVGGLANRDYKVVVPVKCVADFDNDAHKAALVRMEALYGAEIKE